MIRVPLAAPALERIEPNFGHSFALRKFEAVSYTHLRAHETVLDLVCRLLLEKKTTAWKTHMIRKPGNTLIE